MSRDSSEGCVAALVSLFVLLPINTLIRGFVLYKYWAWFVLPLGGPAIGFWHLLGLGSILSYITFQKPNDDDDELTIKKVLDLFLFTLLMAGMFLLFGWIYVSLM
jgi:hypothetical protein